MFTIRRVAACATILAFAQLAAVHAVRAAPDPAGAFTSNDQPAYAAWSTPSEDGDDAAADDQSGSGAQAAPPSNSGDAAAGDQPAYDAQPATPTDSGDVVEASSASPPPDAEAADTAASDVAATRPSHYTIYLVQNPFHSDLIIPRAAFYRGPALIRAAVARTPGGPWVIFGWGPGWFGRSHTGIFHPVPMQMLGALWTMVVPQTYSHLRVAALYTPGAAPGDYATSLTPIPISASNLDRLVVRLNASFAQAPDGRPVQEDGAGAAKGTELFRSTEMYHLLHECNHWTGEILHAGGVETSYILDLLPGSLSMDVKMHTP